MNYDPFPDDFPGEDEVFTLILIHINWHCLDNRPDITPEVERKLYQFIRDYCDAERGIELLEIGGTEDHVHLAVRFGPDVNIADWIDRIKEASARECKLQWDEGFGAVSFDNEERPALLEYIVNQKEHHQQGTIIKYYEIYGAEDDEGEPSNAEEFTN